MSGKFVFLFNLLKVVRAETDDKFVIISNFTQTLDLIERLCVCLKYPSIRLDGSTTINQRHSQVQVFLNSKILEYADRDLMLAMNTFCFYCRRRQEGRASI
eukprot:Gregarina_sp_Poly_1__6131@NODE_323_length_9530_cov_14_322836_g275_i0_p14_GENE_NODE_323_length_9530_cov_14_322836_g275_i0NODE_323_length_9530_cov_14_322836_g275_i0_p14_ORF_typecomplete_len101_score9_43HDA23/PF11496_8/2_1e07Helicase_C/PF00271_31/0_00067_NODE_323_length_9530_cov_14_322836_g275_i015821884